jgi:transposase-like protein
MDQRRWRQWTEQDAREALAELTRTGESIAEFARRRGVSGERVRYWRKRLADRAPAFVAIPVGSVLTIVGIRRNSIVTSEAVVEGVRLLGRRTMEKV